MSERITMDLVLSYKEAKELIKTCIINNEPIMNWGKPGIGKSDMIREIGQELGRPVIDIRAALFSEVDIKGYPYIDQESKTMRFAITNELPRDPDSNAIVFYDEINAALPSTQLALYQLILDGKIGEYELPKGVSQVAAGNREEDRAGLHSMPLPLQNRFVHVETEVNFKHWLEWAIKNTIHKDIVSFLAKNPEKLSTFNPETSTRAFATPRTWTKASNLLYAVTSNEQKFSVIAGCVGVGIATEFIAFLEIIDKLPDPMDILTKKITKIEDIETCLCYAVVTNLLYKLKELHKEFEDNKDQWYSYADNFFEFMIENGKSIGAEFIAMSIAVGYNVYKLPFNVKNTPAMMKAIKKFGAILEGI